MCFYLRNGLHYQLLTHAIVLIHHSTFNRAKELQVVRSKKDIEIPPVAALQSLSIKTWQVRG